MSEHELPEVLTIPEMAALSKESARTIKRRIKEGRLETVHLSARAVRITRTSAVRYLRGRSDFGRPTTTGGAA